MGKKWGWFYAVKKALSPADQTKVVVDKKDSRCRKSSKRKWFGRYNSGGTSASSSEHVCSTSEQENKLGSPPCVYHDAEVDSSSIIEKNNNPNHNHNHHHVYTVAIATAAAAAQAAAEAVWLSVTRLSGKSKEEAAAIRIQATFRGYMARKVYRGMRGLGRLKTLVQGQYVNKQATTTLRCMQTLARVQSQIRARRIRMSEENQLLHKQRQKQTLVRDHKDDKQQQQQLNNNNNNVGGEGWNGSPRSKEQMEARIQRKQEASLRRERALAYAFTHQIALRNKFLNPLMEPNSPIWGWSWLERWMATRPWDNIIIHNSNSDHTPRMTTLSPRAISKSPSTSSSSSCSSTIKRVPATRRMYHSLSCAPSLVSLVKGKVATVNEEEAETTKQHQHHHHHQRRHSITGFSITTSRSLRAPIDTSSSASLRKSRSRPASPVPNNNNYKDKTTPTPTTTTTTTPRIASSSSLKKRSSFLTSPITSRRHSAHPT